MTAADCSSVLVWFLLQLIARVVVLLRTHDGWELVKVIPAIGRLVGGSQQFTGGVDVGRQRDVLVLNPAPSFVINYTRSGRIVISITIPCPPVFRSLRLPKAVCPTHTRGSATQATGVAVLVARRV